MKKFVAVLSAAAMMTSLAACGYTADTANTAASSAETTASAAESTADTAAADSCKVAIVQQLDHASLDEIRVAIEKELDAKAAEKGITIEYKDFNGQNDATTLNQIGTEVVADGYDAIIPITVLHAGGKFGGEDSGYKVAGGLHGGGGRAPPRRVHQAPGHLRGHLRPRRRRPDRH